MPQVLSKRPDVEWALDRSGDQGLKYIIWSIFFVLAFSLSLGEARAADVPFPGTTPDQLNTTIRNSAAGSTIVFEPTNNIVFTSANNAVTVNKNNITINGHGPANDYGATLAALSYQQPLGVNGVGSPSFNYAGLISSTIAPITINSLATTITGGTRSLTTNNIIDFESQKIIQQGLDYNGLSINNINFKDTTITYKFTATATGTNTGGGVVNGFIGNPYSARLNSASFKSLTDNSFSNIDITLHGIRDNHYLAGGGLIGLRSVANSVSIEKVSGNIFNDVTIITDEDAPSGDQDKGSAYIEGGGLIGLDGVSSPGPAGGYAYLAELSQNLFKSITVDSGDMLIGGGLVGVNNNSQNTAQTTFSKLEYVQKNIFGDGSTNNIQIRSGYSTRGGGVVGVNGLSNAGVELTNLFNNTFGGVKVEVGTYLRGGGVVGVQNNDAANHPDSAGTTTIPTKSISANLENAVNNLFYNIQVTGGLSADTSVGRKGEISGGGVIGVRTGPNAASLEYLVNNIFKKITIQSLTAEGKILGGGIVGVSSEWWSSIYGAAYNYFDEIAVTVNNGDLSGGGVIGLYAGPTLSSITDGLALGSVIGYNNFNNVSVYAPQGHIYGGGIIGASAPATAGSARAGFTSIANNVFGQQNSVTVNSKEIIGGGVIGVYSKNSDAYIKFANNNTFTANKVTVRAENIIGGGLIGSVTESSSPTAISSLEYILPNKFGSSSSSQPIVKTTGYLIGGGLVGAVAMGTGGDANIYDIGNSGYNQFYNHTIEIGKYLIGGGIIGVRSSNVASIGYINNDFYYNTIKVGQFIDGGGIIGVTGPLDKSSPYNSSLRYGIYHINKSSFYGNNVTASNGQIAGGLIYSYGLNAPLTIQDSAFRDNTFTSTITKTNEYASPSSASPKVYGTITIDTGLYRQSAPTSNKVNTVILRATNGNATTFDNNQIIDNGSPRKNSLYFGRVQSLSANNSGQLLIENDYARSDAELIIDAAAGGYVNLNDPIEVNQNNENGSYPDRAFRMSVVGKGEFTWAGQNVFDVGSSSGNDVQNTVNFLWGSNTILEKDMSLYAPNHYFDVNPGANMTIHGNNRLTVSGGQLKGVLTFNLANTTLKNSSTALLNITTATHIDIEGAAIKLMMFKTSENPTAANNDLYYLIDTNASGNLVGETHTKYAHAYSSLFESPQLFKIDKIDGSSETDRYLVARLEQTPPSPAPEPTPDPRPVDPGPPDIPTPVQPTPPDIPDPPDTPPFNPSPTPDPRPVVPPPGPTPVDPNPPSPTPVGPTPLITPEDAKIFLEGRVASLGFVAGVGNWLADHSYRSADMAISETNPIYPPSSGDDSRAKWVPYAGVDAGVFWTHKGSKTKYKTFTFITGVNRVSYSPSKQSSFLLSLFIDGGFATYDINDSFSQTLDGRISGDGSIRYIGGGLMARHRWENGFRLEGSARAGTIRNKFSSSSFIQTYGNFVRYELETPYYALHVGVAKEFQIQEKAILDVLLRYFWTQQDGTSYRFESGDVVDFDKTISQRVRLGTRYNRFSKPHLSYYIGGAYEYEFNNQGRGSYRGQPFDTPDIKGSSGVVEIGIIRSPDKEKDPDSHFSIEAGLQGHFGVRRGISGGVRLGWEF